VRGRDRMFQSGELNGSLASSLQTWLAGCHRFGIGQIRGLASVGPLRSVDGARMVLINALYATAFLDLRSPV